MDSLELTNSFGNISHSILCAISSSDGFFCFQTDLILELKIEIMIVNLLNMIE